MEMQDAGPGASLSADIEGGFARHSRLHCCDFMALTRVPGMSGAQPVILENLRATAMMASTRQDQFTCTSADFSFAFRGRFNLPEKTGLIGFVHQSREGNWCAADPLDGDTLLTLLPGSGNEIAIKANTRISWILCPVEAMRGALLALHPSSLEAAHLPPIINLRPTLAAARLRMMYESLWDQVTKARASHGTTQGERVRLDYLLAEHLESVVSAAPESRPTCTRARRAHFLAMLRAEHYMRANLSGDIYLDDLCDEVGTSQRGLRYAFKDLLDTSPIHYLSLMRLSVARESLILSDMSRRSVKSIAIGCGLRDLSRFAENYREVFGELPHDTLMRSPPSALSSMQ